MVFTADNAAEVFVRVVALSIAVTAIASLALWFALRAWRTACAANRYLAWLSLAALCATLPLFGFAGAFAHRHPDIKNATTAPPSTAAIATAMNAIDQMLPVSRVLAVVWAGGSLLLLVRLGVRLRAALVLKRGAPHHSHTPAARRADVLYSDAVTSPVAIGYLRPVILLPRHLADEEFANVREHALAHENAHLRRYDDFTALLYQICVAFAWWNPVVWIVSASLAAEREKACDDAVVLQTRAAKAYGLSLISLCKGTRFTRPDHVLALFEARERLADRIESIVTTRPRSLHPNAGASICCALLASLLGILAVSLIPGFALCARAQMAAGDPLYQTPAPRYVATLLRDGTGLSPSFTPYALPSHVLALTTSQKAAKPVLHKQSETRTRRHCPLSTAKRRS